jgi:hypothetical protein
VRNIAIVPWFAFLFALSSTALAFVARSRARSASVRPAVQEKA